MSNALATKKRTAELLQVLATRQDQPLATRPRAVVKPTSKVSVSTVAPGFLAEREKQLARERAMRVSVAPVRRSADVPFSSGGGGGGSMTSQSRSAERTIFRCE